MDNMKTMEVWMLCSSAHVAVTPQQNFFRFDTTNHEHSATSLLDFHGQRSKVKISIMS